MKSIQRAAKSNTFIVIGLTLLTGAVFKLSAFVREAFIASHFGLSDVTDAYFSLQQFPLAWASFMFGAFALAFAPAYAETKRRSGTVDWMAGLLFYGCAAGTLLTLLMIMSGPAILKIFALPVRHDVYVTLIVLSLCCVPVVCIAQWAGICAARGSNIRSMSTTSLPYLVMTATLFLIYIVGSLKNQSLAISMTAGFGLLGIYGFIQIFRSERLWTVRRDVLMPWRIPEFRQFLRALTASSVENVGYTMNQVFMLYFLARAGTGMISANNYAMRIGMLGYSLFSQPIAQLMQARLFVSGKEESATLFRRWLLIVWGGIAILALGLYLFRIPVIRIVYMRGSFTGSELQIVADILPAWIAYVMVMSLNGVLARYLFTVSQGAIYVRCMLCAYAVANVCRFAVAGRLAAPWVIWCSVIAEGCAMIVALRICLKQESQVFMAVGAEEACL